MIKECPAHGKIEDLIAIDSRFLTWIESNFPGRDLPAHSDKGLHSDGCSSIRQGRGSVLTIDLTNPCNMMCDPYLMDANQVGFVYGLNWEEIKEILDNASKIEPRRQIVIQFSGGEATLSPHLIKAIRAPRNCV